MEKGRAGEQYILGDEPVSYDRFFEMTASYATSPNKLYRVRVPLIMGIARLEVAKAGLFRMRPLITPEWVRKIPFNWSKDSTKANKELGYTARTFEEALKRTKKWLRKPGTVRAERKRVVAGKRGSKR